VFRSTSPMLDNTPEAMLRECPVGRVIRSGPHVYDALGAASHVENGAVDPYSLSAWAREAVTIVLSERARHRELRDREKRSAARLNDGR